MKFLDGLIYKKPVKRLNTGDTTRGGLVKALSHMTDNNDSLNEGWSAYARSVARLYDRRQYE